MSEDFHDPFGVGEYFVEPRLNRISKGSEHIAVRPRAMDLLVYLAARGGAVVDNDEIIEKVWGGLFVTSGVIYNCINELRHAFGDDSHQPSYIETIAKRGYRLIAPVRSIDEEGDADAPERTAATNGSSPKMALVLTGLFVLVLLGALYQIMDMNKAPSAPEHSIAVLAFTDLSQNADQEYFADGVSEELLSALARVPQLRVTGRSSSFTFRNGNEDRRIIGEALGVAHILEGSIRHDGNRVRITALLIDAKTGFHLWSETYDRELTDIFAVQDEISAAIVAALRTTLELELVPPTAMAFVADIDAHQAYLRGRYLVVQRTRATIESAVREFERAIALDPDYALAHAELAIAILLLRRDEYGGLTAAEAVARAAPYAEKALTFDPDLAEAHAATGFLLSVQQNFEESLTHYRHAIQLNPSYAIVHTWMASLLKMDLGRYDEAFLANQTSHRLDPLSIPAAGNYIMALYTRNRMEDADRELAKLASFAPVNHANMRGERTSVHGHWANSVLGNLDALRLDPEYVRSRSFLTREFATIGLEREALAIYGAHWPLIYSMMGRTADAVATAETRLAREPDSVPARSDLGLALAGAGDYARARPIIEEMWQRSGGRVTRFFGGFRITLAAALIAIRRDAGDEADVAKLLAAIETNARHYRRAGMTTFDYFNNVDFDEGLAAYLAGDRERGLELIAKGIDDGYFMLPNEAYFQELYDDPGFAPIRAAQEARQARERGKVLAIVCVDNPYAAFWQPAEGTCDAIAAAGSGE